METWLWWDVFDSFSGHCLLHIQDIQVGTYLDHQDHSYYNIKPLLVQ